MKPRLEPSLLTELDRRVMQDVWRRARFIWLWAQAADRRDAGLMFDLEVCRQPPVLYTRPAARLWMAAGCPGWGASNYWSDASEARAVVKYLNRQIPWLKKTAPAQPGEDF